MISTNENALLSLKRSFVVNLTLGLAAGLLVSCGVKEESGPEAGAGPVAPEGTVSFTKDVAPIIVTHCGPCHIAESKGELSLFSYSVLMQGTLGNGAVILPGFADRSSMVTLIENGEMPKKGGPLSASDQSKIRIWIDEGAFFDGESQGQSLTALTGLTVPSLPEE